MKNHKEEFKQDAVRISMTSGLSRRRVAADLGVGLSTLGKWVSQYRPSDLTAAPAADLARENERLRLENRILKEGVHDLGLHSSAQEATGGLQNDDHLLGEIDHNGAYNDAGCVLTGGVGCQR